MNLKMSPLLLASIPILLATRADVKWKPPAVTLYPNDLSGKGLFKMIDGLGLHKELYKVTTEDGYILCLTRLVLPENKGKKDKGVPMLMVNGLFLQSDGYIIHVNPMDNPAIYWLAHGYDVWLGDQRGTQRSRGHKKYNHKNDLKYWDFTFHETGIYDLPAFIDFILRKTGKQKLCYTGLSLGTTFAFVLLSEKPEYNDKLHLAIMLVPVGDMPVLSSRAVATQALFNFFIELMAYYRLVKSGALFLNESLFKNRIYKICQNCPHLFVWALGELFGGGLNVDFQYICSQLAHQFGGTSVDTFLHTLQLFQRGEFRQFERGKTENLRRYGAEVPPMYNYSKITAPTAFFYSDIDEFSPAHVVKRMLLKFKGPVYSCLLEKTNHAEPIVGLKFGETYSKELLQVLDSATGRAPKTKFMSEACTK